MLTWAQRLVWTAAPFDPASAPAARDDASPSSSGFVHGWLETPCVPDIQARRPDLGLRRWV